ncbi:MAG: aminomethyl-transferring glycine dehydrogenase subunit GcvPA [Firmicutes bacterium]|nr:aminomethyl-transferring glycine dehydrogenase subunit GcvPA [Bacillota bacterium]
MSYVPNPRAVRQEMLEAIGMSSVEELFADIPAQYHIERLNLGPGRSELEVRRELTALASKNLTTAEYPTFLGAGAYDHYIPVAIDQLLLRSEFATTYTPYQAELSQGILQAIFEYQTLICDLTGMDVANASMYDGASALAEACNVATDATRRKTILIPDTVNPSYRKVVATYGRNAKYQMEVVPTSSGIVAEELLEAIDDKTAAVVLQHPNWFGNLETQAQAIAERAHAHKALVIMVVDPISLGLLKPPAQLGADIVVGEGQALGSPLAFGGPYLGFFATTSKLMRRVPGRLVGQTTDKHGERAFVLTLQAREQHIRREKASSNICSTQALTALAATIYLALVGPRGLRAIALRSHQLANYAAKQLTSRGIQLKFQQPFFKEFAIQLADPAAANKRLLENGIIGGYELADGMLLAFTEKRTKAEIDRLVDVLGGMKHAE